MKKLFRRVAAFLLIAVLAASLFPASVFADDMDGAGNDNPSVIEQNEGENVIDDEEEMSDDVILSEESADPQDNEDVPDGAPASEDPEGQETLNPQDFSQTQEDPETAAVPDEPAVPVPVEQEPVVENTIVSQPKDAIVAPNEKAVFAVEAYGNVFSYKWQYSTNGGRTWKDYGSKKSSITVTGSNYWFSSNNGYQYRCIVTFKDKKKTKVISDAATLYVSSKLSFNAPSGRKAENADVSVEAPAGTFPAGTEMNVADVDPEDCVDAINVILGEVTADEVTAVDISFNFEGDEIEPANDNKVTVTLKSDAVKDGVKLVHIDDEGNALEIAEEDIEYIKDGEMKFYSDSFSVYAVVEPGQGGDQARATVNFYGVSVSGTNVSMDTETPIATFYVKNDDELLGDGERVEGKSYIEDIVNDPGIGEILPSGYLFTGWYIGETADYTPESSHMSIEQVRSYLAGLTNADSIKEGDEINVYAMVFKVFSITYLDPNNISLGSDDIYLNLDASSAEYVVSKDYTPTSSTQSFLGWLTEDDEMITNATYDDSATSEPYKMGTKMTISGDITFTVSAPEGHWLVFDENGKGATYNAPVFVKEGDRTEQPPLSYPEKMIRLGYEFKGWYTVQYEDDATVDPSKEFSFGDFLETNKTIYAKWDTVPSANYVVLIWKQNVTGTGYDFADSQTQTEATVNSAITVTNNNNTVTVSGGGKTYSYSGGTGFKYASADTGKTVSPQGNTVVNVYFDREIVTITFEDRSSNTSVEYKTISFNGNSYELAHIDPPGYFNDEYAIKIDGKWYQLTGTYAGRPWDRTWSSADVRPGGTIQTPYLVISTATTNISNTEYTIPSQSQEMSGLYGSTLEQNGYTWPSGLWWYDGVDYWGDPDGTRTTFLDAFLLSDGSYSQTFYGFTGGGTNHVYFQKESSDNVGVFTTTNEATTSNGTFYISDKYNGYKAVSYSTNGTTWTALGDKDSQGYYGSVSNYQNLYIRYSPLKYKILFEDGIYVDGNNNLIKDQPNLGQLKVVENISYGANTSSYNKGQGNYYDPSTDHTVSGFVFEGWFIDDACTQPYTFTTMPEGITVYAKWRQIQYRVFLHPQATLPDGQNDTTLDWGSEDQDMTFRVSYGGSLSSPTGTRQDYEFIGWVTETGAPFNPGSKFTEDLVKTNYDKTDTANYTDKMNKWGEIEGTGWNSDLTGWNGQDRFWITKKLDLYGKWSAKLDGARGIGVIYDPNGGSGAPLDTRQYKDNVDAIAQAAPTTAPTGQRFLYWVVQKWDATAGKYVDVTVDGKLLIVYPGAAFTVLKAYARETDLAQSQQTDEVFKAYTMQLRAEYGKAEVAKDTHITWYANGGTNSGSVTGDDIVNETVTLTHINLQINEAVKIPTAAFSRPGYTFVGWARLSEPEGAFDNENDAVDESKYSPVATPTLWLKLNEDGTTYSELASDGATTIEGKDKIQYVAADEVSPYQAIYAVWKGQYYVYYSGSAKLYAYDINETVNLVDENKLTGLYAGYSSYFGGYEVTAKDMADASASADGYITIDTSVNATAKYNPDKAYVSGVNKWWKTMGTTEAQDLKPEAGTIYYVKEVPVRYLTTRIQYVYDWSQDYKISSIYLLTSIDDKNYQSVWFELAEDDQKKATIAGSFSFVQKGTNNTVTSKVTDFSDVKRGFVGYADGGFTPESDGFIAAGTEFSVNPYWITQDSVTVYGTPRSFKIGEDGNTIEEVFPDQD